MGIIIQALMSVLLFLDSIVYFLISWIYQIILLLCQVDILGNSTEIDALIRRVYVIIGVVILFLVAYSLLRAMVNPDDLKGKRSPANIVKNVLISIALVALTPTIFDFAYDFQNGILMQNTIGKLILGTSTVDEDGNEVSSNDTIADGGNVIAATVLQAFLHPNYDYCTLDSASATYDCDVTINTNGLNLIFISIPTSSATYDSIWQGVEEDGDFLSITTFAYSLAHDDSMTYYFIISTAVGVFVFLVLLTYCIDIAVRTVKLAVFELIAPLPILARIMPGDQGEKVFSNWVKACISTYVEVFIRLAILFFAVLIIKIVIGNLQTIFIGEALVTGKVGFTVFLFTQAFIIIGIILFIKQAPQILKDITGLDSGKYGKSLMKGFGMMTAAFGGGATAAIRRTVADNREHPELGRGKRALRTLGALGSGMKSGLWQGRKTEKPGDIPKNAGRAASAAINRATQIDALGGGLKGRAAYYKQKGENLATDFENWKTGGFDAKQRMLDEVNKFRKDADDIKETSEGFIRKKKYLFSLYDEGQSSKKYTTSDGEEFALDHNTSLSEAERIVNTLNATGKVSDAHIADEINNYLQRRIKKIGQKSVGVAIDRSAANVQDFNNNYMVSGFDIEKEATPMLDDAQAKYVIVQRKFTQNPNLDAVIEFKNKYTDLQPDNISKLSDELGSQSSKIAQDIRLEQERRKNSSNGSGGNNH